MQLRQPEVLNSFHFESHVLGAHGSVMIDVAAAWCLPCQLLGACLPKLASEWHGRLVVYTLDADANVALRERWKIKSYPHVLLFHGGELRRRVTGFTGYAPLRCEIESFLTEVTGEAPPTCEDEEAFRVAAAAAEKSFWDATTPTAEAVGSVLEPYWDAHQAAMAELDRQCAEGVITAADRASRAATANRRLTDLAAPQLIAQRQAVAVGLAAYTEAMATGTSAFLHANLS
jgi:thioredoxin 1